MKKLIRKVIIFAVIPIICLSLIELILPPTFFAHRSWESLSYQCIDGNSYLYPNVESFKVAYGDLCHHTRYAEPKYEYWKTDKLGFRNDEFVEEADVVLVGDSFFAGSGLSQSATIANQIKSKSNNQLKIYAVTPANFHEFVDLIKAGLIKKPKVVIYECVERNMAYPIDYVDINKRPQISNALRGMFGNMDVEVFLDRAMRFLFLKWLASRLNGGHGMGVQSEINPNMFFYEGKNAPIRLEVEVEKEAQIIYSYKKFCGSIGAEFIYIPMPNKETVYYDFVPWNKQPDYLFKLDSALRRLNVKTINALRIFNQYRASNSKLIYHCDDSHWNARGVALVADEILKSLGNLQAPQNKSY